MNLRCVRFNTVYLSMLCRTLLMRSCLQLTQFGWVLLWTSLCSTMKSLTLLIVLATLQNRLDLAGCWISCCVCVYVCVSFTLFSIRYFGCLLIEMEGTVGWALCSGIINSYCPLIWITLLQLNSLLLFVNVDVTCWVLVTKYGTWSLLCHPPLWVFFTASLVVKLFIEW